MALEEVINEGNKAGIRSALAQQGRLWGEGQAGREVCLELYLPINIKLMSSLFLKEKKSKLGVFILGNQASSSGQPFFCVSMLTGAYTALPGPSPSLGAPGKQELGSRSRAGTCGRPRGRASVQGAEPERERWRCSVGRGRCQHSQLELPRARLLRPAEDRIPQRAVDLQMKGFSGSFGSLKRARDKKKINQNAGTPASRGSC